MLRSVLYEKYGVPGDEEDLLTPNMIQQFYDCLIQSIDAVKAWADKVPGFTELCKHDQDQLFQAAALELVMLRIAYTCRFGWRFYKNMLMSGDCCYTAEKASTMPIVIVHWHTKETCQQVQTGRTGKNTCCFFYLLLSLQIE